MVLLRVLAMGGIGLAALTAGAMVARAADTTIVQSGQAFSESEITIAAGDHVKFTNADDVKHNIIVALADDEDNTKDMGIQNPGGTIDVPFDQAGRFKIRCHIHPDMKMTVTVK